MDFINNKNDVKKIRSFLDETYECSLGGRYFHSSARSQMPWARIGVEKFCDRIIPHFSGDSEKAENAISDIMTAIKNAVSFGNSTIIVDANGKTRVGVPESSCAVKDIFGNIRYYEEHVNALDDSDVLRIIGIDGVIYIVQKNELNEEELIETGSNYFSIFYKADGSAPNGRSRISPAIMSSIKEATRNKLRAVEAANFRTFPQWIINGIWEGIDPSVSEGIGKLVAGHNQVMGIPADPNTGNKVSIEEFSSADFNSYISQQEILAKEVAAAFNLDPSELGVSAAQPSSAEALYATKEDLILEISAFERMIHDSIQNALNDISDKTGTNRVNLTWQEPATPSKAAQADAFLKLASVLPQLQYSKKALAWAGLPSDLIEDITFNEDDINQSSPVIDESPYEIESTEETNE